MGEITIKEHKVKEGWCSQTSVKQKKNNARSDSMAGIQQLYILK